ncbi:MAG: FtsX-like permease family protein [Candidatus Neomarinimicrobiota bacterium]
MKLSTFLAKRFMLGGKGAGTSRFTGWIAISGMSIGCLTLIMSISILNGFENRVKEKIIGFEGDIRITYTKSVKQKEDIHNFLVNYKEISVVMPFMERDGIIIGAGNESRMVTFKAVDIDKTNSFYHLGLKDYGTKSGQNNIFIGQLLADRLNLEPGARTRIMSPIDTPIQVGIPRRIQTVVRDIFLINILDYDDRLVFIPMEIGKSLFTRKQGIDGYDIRLHEQEDTDIVKVKLIHQLGEGVIVESWGDLHKGLFQAMRMERIGAILVLSLIILVAAFNLTSTLVLVTYQKVREIGILRTLGASVNLIRSVLIKQGFLIGGTGALIGIILGLVFVLVQNTWHLIPLPGEIYAFDWLPVELMVRDIFIVPVIALILIYVSSAIAAKRAMAIEPKEAIHLEK